MRRAVNTLVAADLFFLLFLALSGFFEGIVSDFFYLAAFIFPITGALLLNRGRLSPILILPKKSDVLLILPLIPLTVALVMGLSAVTTALLGAFGMESNLLLKGNFFEAVLRYALFTAIFEELLFRYLPLRLMSQHSPRITVILSSLFFALVHGDLFKLPYAFAAGAVFMIIDMATNSIVPSLLVHFLNNLLAVTFYFYSESVTVLTVCAVILAAISLVSLAFVLIKRKHYVPIALSAFEKGNVKSDDIFSAWLFIIPTVTISIIAVF